MKSNIYKKDGVNFILGSFYQSNLSNTSNVDIDSVATITKYDMVASSFRLRATYALAKKKELLDLAEISEPTKKERFPIFVPLGLFLLESYPLIQNRTDSAIVCFEFDKKSESENNEVESLSKIEPQQEKTLYAAITIHKGTIYCLDGKGEFIGTDKDLILYLKEIIQKLKIRDIHSTSECYQFIEDNFLNEEINFKKIGLGKSKDFEFNSKDLFWSKRYQSICEKISFTKIHTKKEKKQNQIKLLSKLLALTCVLSSFSLGAYFYFKDETPPPPPPKPAPVFKPVFTYSTMLKDCFNRGAYFLNDQNGWNLASFSCEIKKGMVFNFTSMNQLPNNVALLNSFIKSYTLIKSESQNLIASGGTNSQTVSLTIQINDKGVQDTKIKKASKEEIKNTILLVTKMARSGDFTLTVNSDKKGIVSKWNIVSNFSPMYLNNKYNLFNDIYIDGLSLKIDNRTGIPTWNIYGSYNNK